MLFRSLLLHLRITPSYDPSSSCIMYMISCTSCIYHAMPPPIAYCLLSWPPSIAYCLFWCHPVLACCFCRCLFLVPLLVASSFSWSSNSSPPPKKTLLSIVAWFKKGEETREKKKKKDPEERKSGGERGRQIGSAPGRGRA